MDPNSCSVTRPTVLERRRIRALFYRAAMLWAVGNSLTSAPLVVFMLTQFGYKSSILISTILAAAFLGGLFRLAVPALMERFPHPKQLCIILYIIQIVFLWLMIGCILWFPNAHPIPKILLFTVCWCAANIIEHCAYIVFLSWNASFVARRNLGRYFGRRERWKLCGECAGVVLSALMMLLLTQIYTRKLPPSVTFWNYIGLLLFGTLCILASNLFYLGIFSTESNVKRTKRTWRTFFHTEFERLRVPFTHPVFRPILLYGALFAFFIQFEQTSRFRYVETLIPFGLSPFIYYSILQLVTRGGQIFASGGVGRLVDRFGPLPVMMVSQFLTAFPMLCYFFSSSERLWLPILGSVLWISYVGLNVALPKVQLQFSDRNDDAPWLATYQTCGTAGVFALLIGGAIHEWFGNCAHFYAILFLCAFFWRCALVGPLLAAQRRLKNIEKTKNRL